MNQKLVNFVQQLAEEDCRDDCKGDMICQSCKARELLKNSKLEQLYTILIKKPHYEESGVSIADQVQYVQSRTKQADPFTEKEFLKLTVSPEPLTTLEVRLVATVAALFKEYGNEYADEYPECVSKGHCVGSHFCIRCSSHLVLTPGGITLPDNKWCDTCIGEFERCGPYGSSKVSMNEYQAYLLSKT